MLPLAPTPRKPDVRDPRFNVPMLATVDDEVWNDPYVVEDRANLFTPEK